MLMEERKTESGQTYRPIAISTIATRGRPVIVNRTPSTSITCMMQHRARSSGKGVRSPRGQTRIRARWSSMAATEE